MKKFFVCFILMIAIAGISAFACVQADAGDEAGVNAAYLRVHIRANSNDENDQRVKYKVRDGVVAYLTPVVAECETKEQAVKKINAALPKIVAVAEGILRANGYTYGARASVRREEFPTRVYENVTLEAGVYDALILELGTGAGDNWWCVVYPPLCFTSGNGNVVYKSKILEIVRKFFSSQP